MTRVAPFLAWLAIVTTLAFPVGFMPMRAPDGGLVLAICPGVQPASSTTDSAMMGMHADRGHQMPAKDGHKAAERPCDFSFAAVAHLPDAVIVPPAQDVPETVVAATPDVLTGIFPSGLPPATGPPAIS
ncbi:hypothetical protein [Tsuneonella mangrovi]|uniref:hypothetical protein n=1 Tax=Tsuneonella mangrovi TaxID=1982042 RepID=UPI000BA29E4A|nr:hypothetical protein [Tsuneonella mangrovi]